MIGLLAGRPQDAARWEQICKEVADAMEDSRAHFRFTEEQLNHRHGAFPAVAVGISHGNGTQVGAANLPPLQANPNLPQAPGNLCTGKNTEVLSDLLGMGCFKRLAGFTKCKPAPVLRRCRVLTPCRRF